MSNRQNKSSDGVEELAADFVASFGNKPSSTSESSSGPTDEHTQEQEEDFLQSIPDYGIEPHLKETRETRRIFILEDDNFTIGQLSYAVDQKNLESRTTMYEIVRLDHTQMDPKHSGFLDYVTSLGITKKDYVVLDLNLGMFRCETEIKKSPAGFMAKIVGQKKEESKGVSYNGIDVAEALDTIAGDIYLCKHHANTPKHKARVARARERVEKYASLEVLSQVPIVCATSMAEMISGSNPEIRLVGAQYVTVYGVVKTEEYGRQIISAIQAIDDKTYTPINRNVAAENYTKQ